jgi:nucleoside-diphosphate-sugar epimerase/predicted dehydrogenase
VKVGIVGCGNVARIQLKYVIKYVEKQRVALCDKNELRLHWLANEFGISNAFTDLQVMLREFHPDVVHILTPPHSHKEIGVLCLRSGCHVLLEKPMCISSEEARELLKEAHEKDLLVCVDHMRVLDPLILSAKELLNTGEFGRIVNISITEVDNYLEMKTAELVPKWLSDLPGEEFYDLLPHHLSLLEEFIPAIKFEGGIYSNNEKNELTDMTCLFSSLKASASIRLSLSANPLQNNIVFDCTEGIINVDLRNRLMVVNKKSRLPSSLDRVMSCFRVSKQLATGAAYNIVRFLSGRLDTYKGIDNVIAAFYDAIREKKKSPVPGEKGETIVKLMEAIFGEYFREHSGPVEAPKVSAKAKSVRKADVLVTGGTGFIGQKLVNRLLEMGHNVRVMTHRKLDEKKTVSLFKDKVEIMQGNISNIEDVVTGCGGVETVYHLGAATRGDWFYHLDTTVMGTKNIVEASLRAGVKKLVYVSTIGLLNGSKFPPKGLIDENFDYEEFPEKRGYYSNSKLMAERTVKNYMTNGIPLNISIIRPGLVYGPGKNPLLDVGKKIGNVVIIFGAGKRTIPLVYVENLVDALVLAGDSKEQDTFNVIDKDIITEREFIKLYKKISGEKFSTVYFPMALLQVGFWLLDHLLPILLHKPSSLTYKLKSTSRSVMHSTERIQKRLGWSQKIPLEEGLGKTLTFVR